MTGMRGVDFPGKAALRPWVLAARRVRAGTLRLADLAYGYPSFSQFGEDRVLEQIFAEQADGFYVDVGAYAPVHISNTYLLYRRGWRGINLEPDPAALVEIRRQRPRDINLPFAISDVDDTVEFFSKGSFSGIADARHEWGSDGERIKVQSRPLSSVLDDHLPPGQRIDLLDVDCEGHDLAVLQSNDWNRYRPKVILAEWHQDNDVQKYVEDLGYHLQARMRVTGVFVED
jgi:FkbM family methyltransferase